MTFCLRNLFKTAFERRIRQTGIRLRVKSSRGGDGRVLPKLSHPLPGKIFSYFRVPRGSSVEMYRKALIRCFVSQAETEKVALRPAVPHTLKDQIECVSLHVICHQHKQKFVSRIAFQSSSERKLRLQILQFRFHDFLYLYFSLNGTKF